MALGLEVLAPASTGASHICLLIVSHGVLSQSAPVGHFDPCARPRRTFSKAVRGFLANALRLELLVVVLKNKSRDDRKT